MESLDTIHEAVLTTLESVYDLFIAEIIIYPTYYRVCSDVAFQYEVDVEELAEFVRQRWNSKHC